MLLARRHPAFHGRTLSELVEEEEDGGIEKQAETCGLGEGIEGRNAKWAEGGQEV